MTFGHSSLPSEQTVRPAFAERYGAASQAHGNHRLRTTIFTHFRSNLFWVKVFVPSRFFETDALTCQYPEKTMQVTREVANSLSVIPDPPPPRIIFSSLVHVATKDVAAVNKCIMS